MKTYKMFFILIVSLLTTQLMAGESNFEDASVVITEIREKIEEEGFREKLEESFNRHFSSEELAAVLMLVESLNLQYQDQVNSFIDENKEAIERVIQHVLTKYGKPTTATVMIEFENDNDEELSVKSQKRKKVMKKLKKTFKKNFLNRF